MTLCRYALYVDHRTQSPKSSRDRIYVELLYGHAAMSGASRTLPTSPLTHQTFALPPLIPSSCMTPVNLHTPLPGTRLSAQRAYTGLASGNKPHHTICISLRPANTPKHPAWPAWVCRMARAKNAPRKTPRTPMMRMSREGASLREKRKGSLKSSTHC